MDRSLAQSNSHWKEQSLKMNQTSTYLQLSIDRKSYSFKNISREAFRQCQHSNPEEQNFTFKPQIHQMPHSIYGGRNMSKVQKSRQEIRERLILNTTKIMRERMEAKAARQQDEVNQCTFHPVVSHFSKSLTEDDGHDEEIYYRLFNEAKQKENKRVQAEFEKQKAEKQSMKEIMRTKLGMKSSKSQVLNAEKHNLSRIQNRIEQIIENKMKKRRQLEQQLTQDQSFTFHPEVNQNSLIIAKSKGNRQNLKSNVVERLMQQYQKTKNNQEQLILKLRSTQQKQCTFHPATNHTLTTHTNQKQYIQKLHNHYRHSKSTQTKNFNFVLPIDPISKLIVAHMRGIQDEETRLFRLSQKPIEDKKLRVSQTQRAMYKQLTFKPSIKSKYVNWKAMPKPHRCEEHEEQHFSFKPQINKISRLMRTQSLQASLLKSRKRQLDYKLESEYEEMKECSFKPKINDKITKGHRLLGQVEGTQKFLQKQQRSKQKANQLARRKERLFQLQIQYDERRSKTARQ